MAAAPAWLRGPEPDGAGAVDLLAPDPALLAALVAFARGGGDPGSLLRVSVVQPGRPGAATLPPVAGRCLVTEAGLRFTPHFSFAQGVRYRAVFDPHPLGEPAWTGELGLDFCRPLPHDGHPAVERIYPSAGLLPENLLRFHVCFSRPMQRGRAGTEIALLGPDGRAVADALYRAPVELWDPGMRRLTVLLDPGRLKRGVGPNRALGPPLRAGETYALAIGAGMACSSGRSLLAPALKRFSAAAPVREPIAAAGWDFLPPAAGSREPLLLTATRPLDWASLRGAVALAAQGRAVDGRVDPAEHEMGLAFTPARPWNPVLHAVTVDPELEDVCGNRVDVAFDRPLGAGGGLRPEAPQALSFHPA